MSSTVYWTPPAGVQSNFHTAPSACLTGSASRLRRLLSRKWVAASTCLAAVSMLEVGCCVRSTSSSRFPGPVMTVARPLRVSCQPGGASMLNPAAALLASAAVTARVDQPAAGSAVDGLLSASTDLKPVVVSATEGT